ncbi:MAG: HAD hydrolase-like protein [Myxococcales bacterium]|nr:HAD hydrolase-like protein [Myxococcales bacterium]
MYDLVIFDLDGTLVDSVGDIADALNRTLGTRHADKTVAGWVGSGVKILLERAGVAAADLDTRAAEFRARYAEQPCKHTRPYLRVRETLRAIAGDKAVATNKPGELARTILSRLGLADDFIAVLGEDDVGARKPDPLIVDILRCKIGAGRA